MYPPRQSPLFPQTKAQKRISVERGAQRPSSRQISSAVQSFVGPFGQAALAEASEDACGQVIEQSPASAPPDRQVRSSQNGLHGVVRYWTGK